MFKNPIQYGDFKKCFKYNIVTVIASKHSKVAVKLAVSALLVFSDSESLVLHMGLRITVYL